MVNTGFIFCAIYFTLFIYHFFIFIGRKQDLSNLAYSLYSLSLLVMLFVDSILDIYITLPEDLENMYIMYISFGIASSSSLFLYSVFKLEKYKRKILINFFVYLLFGIIFSIIFFITKNWVWRIAFGVDAIYYIFFFIIITFNKIIKSKIYKDKNQLILMIGFGAVMLNYVFLASIPFLVLYYGEPSNIVSNIAYIFMLFVFAYILTSNFNQEHRDLQVKTKQSEQIMM